MNAAVRSISPRRCGSARITVSPGARKIVTPPDRSRREAFSWLSVSTSTSTPNPARARPSASACVPAPPYTGGTCEHTIATRSELGGDTITDRTDGTQPGLDAGRHRVTRDKRVEGRTPSVRTRVDSLDRFGPGICGRDEQVPQRRVLQEDSRRRDVARDGNHASRRVLQDLVRGLAVVPWARVLRHDTDGGDAQPCVRLGLRPWKDMPACRRGLRPRPDGRARPAGARQICGEARRAASDDAKWTGYPATGEPSRARPAPDLAGAQGPRTTPRDPTWASGRTRAADSTSSRRPPRRARCEVAIVSALRAGRSLRGIPGGGRRRTRTRARMPAGGRTQAWLCRRAASAERPRRAAAAAAERCPRLGRGDRLRRSP